MKNLLVLFLIAGAVWGFFYLKREHPDLLPAAVTQLAGASSPTLQRSATLSARLEPFVTQMSKALDPANKGKIEPQSASEISALRTQFQTEFAQASPSQQPAYRLAISLCDLLSQSWREAESARMSLRDSRTKPSANRAFFDQGIHQRFIAFAQAQSEKIQAAYANLEIEEQRSR